MNTVNLKKHILDLQRHMAEMNCYGRAQICLLIKEMAGLGEAITFNDETGYPYYNDIDEELEPILGVRVVGTGSDYHLEINCCVDDDEPDGLLKDGWFYPDKYGPIDYFDIFDVLKDM